MLILTRTVGQGIVIGENREIVLKVTAIRGGKVRLGIEADASISVRRVEPETVPPTDHGFLKWESRHVMGTACHRN